MPPGGHLGKIVGMNMAATDASHSSGADAGERQKAKYLIEARTSLLPNRPGVRTPLQHYSNGMMMNSNFNSVNCYAQNFRD
jgi:hypothetical protein